MGLEEMNCSDVTKMELEEMDCSDVIKMELEERTVVTSQRWSLRKEL